MTTTEFEKKSTDKNYLQLITVFTAHFTIKLSQKPQRSFLAKTEAEINPKFYSKKLSDLEKDCEVKIITSAELTLCMKAHYINHRHKISRQNTSGEKTVHPVKNKKKMFDKTHTKNIFTRSCNEGNAIQELECPEKKKQSSGKNHVDPRKPKLQNWEKKPNRPRETKNLQ